MSDVSSPEGGRSNRPPSIHCKASTVFPGRYLCDLCGLPVIPSDMTEKGICVVCAEKVELGKELILLQARDELPAPSKFSSVLSELKNSAGPAVTGLAEAILEASGGPEAIGKALWEDIQAVRGANLSPEMRSFHTVDYKVLKGMNDTIVKVLETRDEHVGAAKDPLESLEEKDLMLVASEAARVRCQVDSQFRREIIGLIQEVEPKLIEEYYLARFGIGTLV